MTVQELIDELREYPRDLQVVYQCYSEQVLLEAADICVERLCVARSDGWVENYRKDKESAEYLVLPGN